MMDNLLSLIGIARRAARISLGYDMTVQALKRGKSKLVVLAADVSDRTRNSVCKVCRSAGVLLIDLDCKMDDFLKALGKPVGIVSVNDDGFAKKIIELSGKTAV